VLITAGFYDFLRSSTEVPPVSMNYESAKTYLSPEMVLMFRLLMETEDNFTAEEAQYLDWSTIDLLLSKDYEIYNIDHDMATRPGGPERKMPYMARGGFGIYFSQIVFREPVGQHQAIVVEVLKNYKIKMVKILCQIMNSKDVLLLNPFTDQRFEYSIPNADVVAKSMIDYMAHKDILQGRRISAIHDKETLLSDARDGITAMQVLNGRQALLNKSRYSSVELLDQATSDIQNLSLASTGLAGAVAQARASRNAAAAMSKLPLVLNAYANNSLVWGIF
jgi:hypothetical protein